MLGEMGLAPDIRQRVHGSPVSIRYGVYRIWRLENTIGLVVVLRRYAGKCRQCARAKVDLWTVGSCSSNNNSVLIARHEAGPMTECFRFLRAPSVFDTNITTIRNGTAVPPRHGDELSGSEVPATYRPRAT